jgi:ATP-dependent protease ClpP protease subunit
MSKQIIVWNTAIDLSFVNAVVDKLNDASTKSIVIYLSSSGGSVAAGKVLTDIINNRNIPIELIVTGILQSAAFSLFFNVNCGRKMIPGVIGMYHSASVPVDINHHGNPMYQEGVAYKKLLTTEDKAEAEYMCDYLEMTPLQKKKIMGGHDVFFTTAEMQKFLETSNKKNSGK